MSVTSHHRYQRTQKMLMIKTPKAHRRFTRHYSRQNSRFHWLFPPVQTLVTFFGVTSLCTTHICAMLLKQTLGQALSCIFLISGCFGYYYG